MNSEETSCCTPGDPDPPTHGRAGPRGEQAADSTEHLTRLVASRPEAVHFVPLGGGPFEMGSATSPYPDDGEGPVRTITLSPFQIATTAVSNAQFAAFVHATGWVTDAERIGWSFVFDGAVDVRRGPAITSTAPWWSRVPAANWLHPEGAASDLAGREDHPVVHVSHRDAQAYCGWIGGRLPTEAQWEFAARGGLQQQPFPWGSELLPDGQHRMNVWQGRFPDADTAEDGYAGTAPVDAYPPNGYGLHNVTGNVWEWCDDRFSRHFHASKRAATVDPIGPRVGEGRVLKGGSFLCHASYCLRYRVSARIASSADSTASNVGFRCAR